MQRRTIRSAISALILLAGIFNATAAVRITGDNQVIYDIVEGTMNVKISNYNTTQFKELPVSIVIPEKVVDASPNASTTEPYTVIGFAGNSCFASSKIKGIELQAPLTEIPDRTFEGCDNLQTVKLPDTIKKIGLYAFHNDKALTTIEMPGVTEVMSYAFKDCSKLDNLLFGENLLKIYNEAFMGCSSLSAVKIPDSATSLMQKAFQDCTSLQRVEIGKGVTEIGSSAFYNCPALETLVLNEGLTSIQSTAFYGCSSLKFPGFPSTLKNVMAGAFQKCASLGKVVLTPGLNFNSYVFANSYVSEVVFPEEPMHLDDRTFMGCTGLTEVTIPAYVDELESGVFQNCTELKNVTLSEGVAKIGSSTFNGCTALTTISLPSSLKEIGASAFYGCGALEDFAFPNVMDKIGNNAFNGCKSLRHLILPAGAVMENITSNNTGCHIFGNTELRTITFPDEPIADMGYKMFDTQAYVEEMTFPGWMTTIPRNICEEWKGLKKVTFEEGVEETGTSSFAKCDLLSEIVFPENSFKKIGNSSFSKCGFTTISFPNSLETIGEEAFSNNPLTAIETPASLRTIEASAFSSCRNVTSLILSDGLVSIGSSAFYNLDKLETLVLPSTLERIEVAAFRSSKLPGLTLPQSLKFVGRGAFQDTFGFTEITLTPDTYFDYGAFYNCKDLVTINFPEAPCQFAEGTSSSNKEGVFYDSDAIVSVTLPDWLTEVPGCMFRGCSKLNHVDLAPLTNTIGDRAFETCVFLENVEFPSTVTKIGAYAFASINDRYHTFGPVTLNEGCTIGEHAFDNTTVTAIIFDGCPTDIGTDALANLQTIAKISFPECWSEIPAGFCKGWTTLSDVTIPESIKKIGDGAFQNCGQLLSIDLPEGLEELGASAFQNSGLTSITIPESLRKIGDFCFNSTKFTEFHWTDTPVELGVNVFQSSKLVSIEIPRWMSYIPKQTFNNCTSLTTVTFEDRSAEDSAPTLAIGESAFQMDSKIESIEFPAVPLTLYEKCFRYLAELKSVKFANFPISYNGNDADFFGYNKNLTVVVIPDAVTVIGRSMFSQCTALERIELGSGVELIRDNAFAASGLKEIVWSPALTSIEHDAFKQTQFVDLTLPSTLTTLTLNCFQNCKELETLTIPEGYKTFEAQAFENCTALKEVTLPKSLTTLNTAAFNGCSSLEHCYAQEGLEYLWGTVFQNCTSLKEFTIPSTVTKLGNKIFQGCTGLQEVTSHVHNATFDEYTFSGCSSLRRFESTDSIEMLGQYCFQNCKNLEEFVHPADKSVGYISKAAFNGCEKLKAFPYMQKTRMVLDQAFQNCKSLVQVSLPAQPGTNACGKTSGYMFNGADHLQSLIFPNTNGTFELGGKSIVGAPLKALSYSYATGCKHYGEGGTGLVGTITNFDNYLTGVIANPKQSTLVVTRGQKWRFETAGYGKVFNIIEEKAPEIKIEGDIFSTYDADEDVNHYQAFIRWEVPLSDLNQEDETVVEVTRDAGTPREHHVARVVFGKPSEPIATTDIDLRDPQGNRMSLAADSVIVVRVSIDGRPNQFFGDYDFPITKGGETMWEMRYGYETPDLYFDHKTHRRVVAFDRYGYTSWFIMADRFDSPKLSSENVPAKYTYSAVMNGYEYDKPYNYEPLVADKDGNFWTTKREKIPDLHSIDCDMYTALAMPTLDGTGFYTLDEIREQDRQRELSVIPSYADDPSKCKYSLGWDIDEALLLQKGYIESTGATPYIINSVKVVDITDPAAPDTIRSQTLSLRRPHQSINLSSLRSNVVPGRKYRTVVQSLFRGTFGSPVITIPDAPTLSADPLQVKMADHFLAEYSDHSHAELHAVSTLNPVVTGMGYEDNVIPEGSYRLGVWRGLSTMAPQQAQWYDLAAMAAASPDLLHHVDGHEEGCSSDCGECDQLRNLSASVTETGSQLTYSDVFNSALGANYSVNYDHRLYVKVPQSYIPGDERWMLADTSVDKSEIILSGVEDVSVDNSGQPHDPSLVRWYDLQGRPVATPVQGQTYLRVTPSGVTKLRY